MAQLPAIYTIQASDAPQHTGKLQGILQNLKTENRIGSFTTLGADEDLSSITDTIQEEELILVVLTHQLDSQREQIETELKALQSTKPGVRIGEIIVDNVPYENEFITFPADLRNIRNREDMDAVWNGIDQSLKDMFPAEKKPEPAPPMDWPKYLKISGIIIGVILVVLLLRPLFVDDNGATEERIPVDVEEAQPAEVEEMRPELEAEAVPQSEIRERLEDLRESIRAEELEGRVSQANFESILQSLSPDQIDAILADEERRRQFELKLEAFQQDLVQQENMTNFPSVQSTENERVLQSLESVRQALDKSAENE